MTIYYINTGSSPNKGDGDTLRTAFNKINASFGYIDGIIQNETITINTTSILANSISLIGQHNFHGYNTNGSVVFDYFDNTVTNSIISVGPYGSLGAGPGSLNIITEQNNPIVFYQNNIEAGRIGPDQKWRIDNLEALNLTVQGIGLVSTAANLVIESSLLYLAENNPSNVNDIGFVGHFNNGVYQHTGLFRKANENKWYLASGITSEVSNVVSTTDTTFTPDTLELGSLIANTLDVQTAVVDGNLGVVGTLTVLTELVSSSIIPLQDTTYDLGSPTNQWRHIFVSTGSIYLGNIKLSSANGKLDVSQVNYAVDTATNTIINETIIQNYALTNQDKLVKDTHTFNLGSNGTLYLDGVPFTGGAVSSATAPTSPSANELWFNSTDGKVYIYYDNAWVDTSVPTITTPVSPSFQNKTPTGSTDTGTTGDIVYDSSYVYICVSTNTWIRSAIVGGW